MANEKKVAILKKEVIMLKKWNSRRKAKSHFFSGKELRFTGRQKEAITEFTQAITLDEDLLDAYLHRGISYIEMGEAKQGIDDLSFVIDLESDISPAYYYRSMGYMKLEKINFALADIEKAIELSPQEPANYLQRGAIQFFRKEYENAIKDATVGIELGFEEAGYNNRAIFYEGQKKYNNAIEDWTKVIEINSDSAKAYCRRGMLFAQTGKVQSAISDLKTGLEREDNLDISTKEDAKALLENLMKSRDK